jgi:hypothetical protein
MMNLLSEAWGVELGAWNNEHSRLPAPCSLLSTPEVLK